MFLDILSSDGLLIAARGIGLENVFSSLLRVYCDPGNLVLVMGTTDEEEEHFTTELQTLEGPSDSEEIKCLPKKITAAIGASERQQVYRRGGVLFVTTRILVVDMLTDRLPIHLVTGVLVYRAHKTAESCQESFVLRLFRQKNSKGFIKAFSSSPIYFKGGFCRVERVMRSLFLKELFLWPRFRAEIADCLREREPEVVELRVAMTPAMLSMQTALMDLLRFTLQELKRLNPSLESYEELTLENSLSKSFSKLLQRELDPVWHQLSWKSKQLVSDIKTLRTLVTFLTQYDCITFLMFVNALRTTENAMRSGGWMILDAAETLFLSARKRVLGSKNSEEQAKTHLQLDFESNPKWKALNEILREIHKEVEKVDDSEYVLSDKVLILTYDERTSSQLQQLLSIGEEALMVTMYNKNLGEKYGFIPGAPADLEEQAKREPKHKGMGKKSSKSVQTLTQLSKCKAEDDNSSVKKLSSPVILVQSMQAGEFELFSLLFSVRPRCIIMYDADMTVVRQIEVFQAKHPFIKVRVYFLMFEKSMEEQAYLTTLRREKEAFEHLIQEKGSIVIPEDNPELGRGSGKASDAIMTDNSSSRKAGGAAALSSETAKIIVDMREFRSELPSLIHKRGIDIEPVTIEVGDYILTPDICVERKSISDLIGSLQNGRLYNQATNMTRFYEKPMLLIEFDQSKPFALQGKYYLSRDIGSSDVAARLQLLTLHFPRLRILWSPSPHATAELFEELKRGRDQPDAAKAAAILVDLDCKQERFNQGMLEFVSKLPGITSRNVYAVLNRLDSLAELNAASKEELEDILESKDNATLLYGALHDKVENMAATAAKEKRTTRNTEAGQKGPKRFKSRKK